MMADKIEDQKFNHRTPTETLMHCLEDFGEAEPERVIVVYTNDHGELCWSLSGPRVMTHIIGMLECVLMRLRKNFMELGPPDER